MEETRKRILIVEDEKPMARALELKLSHEGYEIESALNGETALELAGKGNFSLIILDLVLPKVDGFKVLEGLKIKNISTPTIVLTNLNQGEDEKKAKELGAKEFFIKSNISIAEIVGHVKRIIQ